VDSDGNPVEIIGLLYGGTGQFQSQLAGVVVIWTVMFGLAYLFWKLQDVITKGGIRVSEEDEQGGIDIPEMGVLAYQVLRSSRRQGAIGAQPDVGIIGKRTHGRGGEGCSRPFTASGGPDLATTRTLAPFARWQAITNQMISFSRPWSRRDHPSTDSPSWGTRLEAPWPPGRS